MKRLYIQSSRVKKIFKPAKNIICFLTMLCCLHSPQARAKIETGNTPVQKTNTNTAIASSIPIGKGKYQFTMVFKKFTPSADAMTIVVENYILVDDLKKYQPSDPDHSFSITKEINITDEILNLEYDDKVAKVLITMLFKKTSNDPTPSPKPEPEPVPEPIPAPAPTAPTAGTTGQFNVNFTSGLASNDWNNIDQAIAGKSLQLRDAQGKTSNVNLTLETSWNEAKDKGYSSGNNTGLYPDAVMQTYFYTTTEESITLSGLNPALSYDFTFFASSAYGGDRTTEFSINGKQVAINAAYNKDKAVTLQDMQADAAGELTITVKKANTATYAFLNALVISAKPEAPSVTVNLAELGQSSYETGSSITLEANCKVSNDTISKITFYANNHEIAHVTPEEEQTSFNYTWKDLQAGTYQLKAVAEARQSGKVSSLNQTLTVEKKEETAVAQQGVNYAYYIGRWGMLPPFDKVTVRKEGIVENFSLAPRNRNDFFGFRFRAYLKIDQSGEYTFYTKSDDGSRLIINNAIVVDNNGKHASREKSGKVHLSKGLHPIEVTYFEYTGKETLMVSYAGPGISKCLIPSEVLFTTKDVADSIPAFTAEATGQFNVNNSPVNNTRKANTKQAEALSFVENTTNNSDTVKIYPVPTNDILYIAINNDSDFAIYNAKGQVVRQGHVRAFSQNSISVTDLRQGVYHIHFTGMHESIVRKFMVMP